MVSAGHSAGVRSARDLRHELIAELYREGLPVADIAQRAGVCVKTVRNVARRAGLPPRNPSQPERDGEILARYIAGDPVAAIAADHGVGSSRVRVVAERAGVPPRSGWQRRYPMREDAFDQPTATGWWLIGLLAADGSIHAGEHRISLCQTLDDADVLYAFYDYVGIYRGGREPRVRFSGTRRLMEQCEAFWRETLPYSGPQPAATPHRKGLWQFSLCRMKARAAADRLLRSSQRSLPRKRAILAEIAAYRPNKVL